MESRKLVILYGSETGTAQDVAERIWRESKCYHYHGPVRAMDEYPISELVFEQLVIFVCSTTGQGDQPNNMKKFWRFLLRKSLPANSLQNLRFGVLGLGDSSYVKFNHVAKKLYRRLESLGGLPLCPVGLADDQHDLGADAVIDPWIEALWHRLQKLYPLPQGITVHDKNALPPPRWNVSVVNSKNNNKCSMSLKWERDHLVKTEEASVIDNERITASDHFQDVRLVRLQCNLPYNPGDVVMIRPRNRVEAVDQLISMLTEMYGINESTILFVTERDVDMPVPFAVQQPLTLYQCVSQYFDLNAVPRRYTFQLLAKWTTSDLEEEKLNELASPNGQEELYSYCNRPRRSILEVLVDFPYATANIPLPYLFEIFQPIRPRAFSIASSPKAHSGEIHVLLAVVKYKTKLVLPRLGLCSNWLAAQQPGSKFPVSVKKGSFTFPNQQNVPIIMVGPGTGVAPFRSIIQQMFAEGKADKDKLLLIFGNRNRAADFHCSKEWLHLVAQGHLTLITAFSRDQPHKIYVQHVMEEQSELIWHYLQKGAWLYVAGSSNNMPTAVREAFVKIYVKEGNMSTEEATLCVDKLELNGYYQTETWS